MVQLSTIFSFDAPNSQGVNTDGRQPNVMVDGGDGYIYGSTGFGGSQNYGTLFKIKYDGTGSTVLHNFGSGTDGKFPTNGLVVRGTTLYGTTQQGGTSSFAGTVYKANTDGSGYTVIHDFSGFPDGTAPDWIALSPGRHDLGGGGEFRAAVNSSGAVVTLPASATASTTVTVSMVLGSLGFAPDQRRRQQFLWRGLQRRRQDALRGYPAGRQQWQWGRVRDHAGRQRLHGPAHLFRANRRRQCGRCRPRLDPDPQFGREDLARNRRQGRNGADGTFSRSRSRAQPSRPSIPSPGHE